jgi:hypothetical protein
MGYGHARWTLLISVHCGTKARDTISFILSVTYNDGNKTLSTQLHLARLTRQRNKIRLQEYVGPYLVDLNG